jgi:hypothetical protein
MRRGNGYGNHRTTVHADMAAYDAAPPPVRWVLRNAVGKWASKPMARKYEDRREFQSHEAAMRHITCIIADREAEHTLTAYGPAHPEARR